MVDVDVDYISLSSSNKSPEVTGCRILDTFRKFGSFDDCLLLLHFPELNFFMVLYGLYVTCDIKVTGIFELLDVAMFLIDGLFQLSNPRRRVRWLTIPVRDRHTRLKHHPRSKFVALAVGSMKVRIAELLYVFPEVILVLAQSLDIQIPPLLDDRFEDRIHR